MNRDTTIWWSTCDECFATLAVWPHPEREEDLGNPDEWERFWPDCPVCDASMHWEGSDTPTDMVALFQGLRQVKR